jgi:hypothetical protein
MRFKVFTVVEIIIVMFCVCRHVVWYVLFPSAEYCCVIKDKTDDSLVLNNPSLHYKNAKDWYEKQLADRKSRCLY